MIGFSLGAVLLGALVHIDTAFAQCGPAAGSGNTACGTNALQANTGINNTATGENALTHNAGGFNNLRATKVAAGPGGTCNDCHRSDGRRSDARGEQGAGAIALHHARLVPERFYYSWPVS